MDLSQGVIGLSYRSVPCNVDDKVTGNVASLRVYAQGDVGHGWFVDKFEYSNFNLHTEGKSQGEQAFCGTFQENGGVNFRTSQGTQPSVSSQQKLQVWIKTDDLSKVVFTIKSEESSTREVNASQFDVEQQEGEWYLLSISLENFDIIDVANVDSIILQYTGNSNVSLCVQTLVIN
eukprot:TRINITY_DN60354_c0_g1_i1.p1 TRINITY_DN60354_c0_g1~~TRINITY_DN60354_c0_g1_i1.p1  ORF type:complete len:176 (-),score=11.77 TRINITY_DN60354_c0_g1_i1:151-678(-)